MTAKGDFINKWTPNEKFLNNYDKIFKGGDMKVFPVTTNDLCRMVSDDSYGLMLDKDHDTECAAFQGGEWRTFVGIRMLVPVIHRPTNKDGYFELPPIPEKFKDYKKYIIVCEGMTGFCLCPK